MKYRWPLLFLILITGLVVFWRPLTFRIKVCFLSQEATAVAEAASQTDQSMAVDAIRRGVKLVERLAKLDKTSAVNPARLLMRRSITLWPDWKTFIMSSGHDLARYIPELTEIRIEGGDTNALPEYAAWIKSIDEEKIEEYSVEAFEPLWRHPNDPAVQSASDWLFNDPASPWSKLPWRLSTFHDPLDSGLVKVPAFRRLLTRTLEDKLVVGSMGWQSGMGINISYKLPRSSGGFHFNWPETVSPTNGTKVEIRYCDWIAWKLSNAKQIPFFNPFNPTEQRDAAITNAVGELIKTNQP